MTSSVFSVFVALFLSTALWTLAGPDDRPDEFNQASGCNPSTQICS